MEWTRKFTLLGGLAGAFRGAAARGRIDEASRRQRLIGTCDRDGVSRCLFGEGEGPTEAVAEAKQERDDRNRGASRSEDGLHEPAKRTRICTEPSRLAFCKPSANLRLES